MPPPFSLLDFFEPYVGVKGTTGLGVGGEGWQKECCSKCWIPATPEALSGPKTMRGLKNFHGKMVSKSKFF